MFSLYSWIEFNRNCWLLGLIYARLYMSLAVPHCSGNTHNVEYFEILNG
jgi:hypothetical protein